MADLTVAIHDDLSSSVSVELSDPEIPVFIGYDPGDEIPGPTGNEGKRVELRNNGTAIQWKYITDTDWIDLIQNDDLIPPGSGVSLPINISDVTGLDHALNGKAPSVHEHTIAEIATLSAVLTQIQTVISNLQSTNVAFSSQLDSNTNAINAEVYDREQAIIHLQSYVAGVQNSLVNDINALWMHMNAIEAFRDTIDSNSDGVVDDSERLGGEVAANYALKSYVDTSVATREPSITAPADASKVWDGTKTFRALTQADIAGLGSALAAKEASITAPADASKVWDGTKTFRALTQSDVPGLPAAIANRKGYLYFKKSGSWYHNGINATAFSTIGLTASSANCPLAYVYIEEVTVITDIAVEVTTAGSAGSVMHFGLYNVDDPSSAYNVGPLVAATTTAIAANSTGVKSLTLASPVTLQPGVYLATVSTNSTTSLVLRALAQGAMFGASGNATVSSAIISSLSGTRSTFAALPSNLSGFTAVKTVAATNSFVFWYKVQ